MMKSGRIASLKKQHSQLEQDLAALRACQGVNHSYVQTLKCKKLLVKDMLAIAIARQQPEMRVYALT